MFSQHFELETISEEEKSQLNSFLVFVDLGFPDLFLEVRINHEAVLSSHLTQVRDFKKPCFPEIPKKLVSSGTPFQTKVWEAALQISYGNVKSYKQIAEMIHSPQAARAVGNALSRNPFAYLIPCHRVIPHGNGSVGGFKWGENLKKKLLKYEAELKN